MCQILSDTDQCLHRNSETVIVGRLEGVEKRLDALEQVASTSGNVSDALDTSHNGDSAPRLPAFHHGAGHKLLQYWSRVRVQLTIPDVHVLQYLREADEEDPFPQRPLEGNRSERFIPIVNAIEQLRDLHRRMDQLPISLAALLEKCELFQNSKVRARLESRLGNPDLEDSLVDLYELSVVDLLVLSIAFNWCHNAHAREISQLCLGCFRIGLQKLWLVHMESEDIALPTLLCAAHIFLYCFARPFHAQAMLRTCDAIMANSSRGMEASE